MPCDNLSYSRVRTGFGKHWKVIKVENAIFQDLKSLGKREHFQNGYGNVLDFFGKIRKSIPRLNVAQWRIKHSLCHFCSFRYL